MRYNGKIWRKTPECYKYKGKCYMVGNEDLKFCVTFAA